MKKIVSGSDAIINLELKDSNGNIIPLYDDEVVNTIKIVVTTKNSNQSIIIDSTDKLQDNHIKLDSDDLDRLDRGQIIIEVYIRFYCEEFEDGNFDYRNKIATNLILV